jgi:hypothetical protein
VLSRMYESVQSHGGFSQRFRIHDDLFEYVRRKDIQQLVDNNELAALASQISVTSESKKSDVCGRKMGTPLPITRTVDDLCVNHDAQTFVSLGLIGFLFVEFRKVL